MKWLTSKQYLGLTVVLIIFCKYIHVDICRYTQDQGMFLRNTGSGENLLFCFFRIIQTQCLGLSNYIFVRNLSTLVSKW